MANTGIPQKINLRTSVNVDSINRDIWPYDSEAPALQNTGIERQGGITNIYETEVLNAANEYAFVTEDGQTLLIKATSDPDNNTLEADGSQVGLVSSWGVQQRVEVTGFDDVMLTADGTYITCKLIGDTVTISEYDFDNVLLNTRDVTFTNLVNYIPLFTSFNFVRYQPVHYVDDQEFALRLGEQFFILKESTPSQVIVISSASTTVLGSGNAIRCSLVLNGVLIVAGDNGRVGSFDGALWRNYDGSGAGLGPYNSGTVTGNNRINAIAAYGTGFAVAGVGGRLGSWDGSAWKNYDATGDGTGPSDNGTLIGTNTINAMAVWREALAVGGAGGRLGSVVGTTKYVYTASKTVVIPGHNYPPPLANADVIGANDINAMANYTSGSEPVLVVAGAAGLLASFDGGWVNSSGTLAPTTAGTTWVIAGGVAPAASGWTYIAYGNGLWVAIAVTTSTSGAVATSPDGVTWTARTTPAPAGNWRSVSYGNGLFVAVATTNSTTAALMTSPDGITWTMRTIPVAAPSGWSEAAYGNGLWVAVALTTSTTQAVMTSPDGITWTARTNPAASGSGWASVVYGNGTWVAVAFTLGTSGVVMTSPDGITWTNRPISTGASTTGWWSVSYGNGLFVAVARNTSTTQAVMTSPDGITWTLRTTPAAGGGGWGSVRYGAGLWCALAQTTSTSAAVITSPDGITWTARTTPAPAAAWVALAFGGDGNGRFTAVANTTSTTQSFMGSMPVNPVPISNNATAVSTDAITSMLTDTSLIVIASALGKIASYNGTSWNNYNSGSGFSDNAVAVGANQVNAITKFGTTYVFGAATGLLASWDGTNWKNYDGTGTGTGVYNNQTVVGAVDITALGVLNSLLWIGSAGGAENSMTSAGVFTPLYTTPSGGVVANLMAGQSVQGYLYTYRYENGLYLIDLVGNVLNQGWILNDATKAVVELKAQFAVPQVSGGFTRHILTETPRFDASGIYGVSLVGYTDFVTFTSTQQYPTTRTGISAVNPLYLIGYNYVDSLFEITANPNAVLGFYAPQVNHANPTAQFTINQPNTETNIFAYGKLTNAYGLAPTVPFEIRVLWTGTTPGAGSQSTLSVAILDGQPVDAVGTLITNVGEFDDTYTPLVQDDSTILYQFGGKWFIVVLSQTPALPIQKLTSTLYKVNTISPLNLYDAKTRTLELGSSDFNSRMLFNSTATPSLTATKVVSIVQGKWSNGIDTGDKLIYIPTPTSANIEVIGYRLPSQLSINPTYQIDTFLDDVYAFSTGSDGSEFVVPDKVDTVYVSNTILPEAIGGTYYLAVLNIGGQTIILQRDYDGYQIGNQLAGTYQGFQLFGAQYLFDGRWVYLLTADTATQAITSLDKVAPGDGLVLISSAPTTIYFLSSFDNSIYTFDGGRALNKFKRFSQQPAIIQGLFSVHDNTLVLETAELLIWIRDNIISINAKKVAQASLRLYDTVNGIVIGNNTGQWQYTFLAVDQTSTVVPLVYQTSFYGVSDTKRSILRSFVLTVYSATASPATITWKHDSFDQDEDYEQTEVQQVNANDYNSSGYARIRLQPKYQRSLGNALTISCETKILLLGVTVLYEAETEATIRPGLSK